MSTRSDAVIEDLKAAGASDEIIKKARKSLQENFPPMTYTVAVWFLGLATMLLVSGAVASLLLGKGSSDALWTAVGAGIGALAGIFTAKSS